MDTSKPPQITASTSDMLEAIRAEKRALQRRLTTLEERERVVVGWLAEESPQQELPIAGHGPPPPPRSLIRPRLASFLRKVIDEGKPKTNQELAELAKARGIVEEDVDLRKINSIMLGFFNAGEVRREGDNWVVRRKNAG